MKTIILLKRVTEVWKGPKNIQRKKDDAEYGLIKKSHLSDQVTAHTRTQEPDKSCDSDMHFGYLYTIDLRPFAMIGN